MIRSNAIRGKADSLKRLITSVKSNKDLPDEVVGHMGRYLCVICAGFIETSLAEVFADYVTKRSAEEVASFCLDTLRKIQNPKASRIEEVCARFDKSISVPLKQYLDDGAGARRLSIDSVMNNRHQIAHGKQSSITIGQVETHLERAIDVFVFIENHFHL
ncbi:hypothetical protein C7S18_09420 [Ahniella affigens]|uniref:RiboL-PSP-HEPN domain-containing protein n=1 Tax=Ahniella affigens TaxID=2021234 RepID=A0A2P1PRC2_9GAMM|nr:HEPN domain-containing protein [Ahniella affigens]AVP97399.1 hypothetical protein C7S18_09420 [Ahniella affigens]